MSNFLVLELGSKSLKIHRKTSSGGFEKVKVPWAVGHEVYRDGSISPASKELVSDVVRRLEGRGFRKEAMLAVATGAIRDAGDRDDFVAFLKDRVKIGVRVLSGREEASLLAQGFLQASRERPALIIDIGGGTLETVYLEANQTVLRDSLPLGAIRLHYLGLEEGGGFDFELVADQIEGILREASVVRVPEVNGTGGPVKAVSKVLGKKEMSLEELRALEERVRRDGPPRELSEERAPIFLPGLMAIRRFLEHCRGLRLRYLSIPVGRIFLERFLGRMSPELDDRANARLLSNIRITQILRPGE
jgi:exopolyphosphatase/pppGpp-phosphohydrolase